MRTKGPRKPGASEAPEGHKKPRGTGHYRQPISRAELAAIFAAQRRATEDDD